MGFFGKIIDGFRSSQNDANDDYFLDDDYYDDDFDYEESNAKSGFFSGRNQSSDSGSQKSGGLFGSRAKVVPAQPSMQVSSKRPKNIDDSADICDDLLDGMAVIINLDGISQTQAQRIIDFTYGAVYSIDGDLKMISKFIFIATPHSVSLSGEYLGDFNMKSSDSSSNQQDSRERAASGRSYGFNA